MKNKQIAIIICLLFILGTFITLIIMQGLISINAKAGNPPPPDDLINGTQHIDGDWIINSIESYTNETIFLNGNLTIQNGGSLTFYNVTLIMNNTFNGEFNIEVEAGGSLYIYDLDNNNITSFDASNITSTNPNNHYQFWVRAGSTFIMNYSELHECGWTSFEKGFEIETDNLFIFGNEISNNYYAISFMETSNNFICNNNISKNYIGIYLQEPSSKNKIMNNTIYNNDRGIYLSGSSNNLLNNNTIINNWFGIITVNSLNNIFKNNTFTNDGIHIYGYLLEHFFHDLDLTNRVNDKPIYYLLNETGLDINGWDIGQLFLINCSESLVRNLNITNAGSGIMSAFSSNITCLNNNLSMNDEYGVIFSYSSHINISYNEVYFNGRAGIALDESSYNNLFKNQVISNLWGIRLSHTPYNNIFENNVSGSNDAGINIDRSSNNSVFKNRISPHNGIGVSIFFASNNNITSNNISMNDVYGIELFYSSNIFIWNNNISSNSEEGILLLRADNNTFLDNDISYNYRRGIYILEFSNDNTFNNNTVNNNNWGSYIRDSSNNCFNNGVIHNNLLGVYLNDNSNENHFNNCSFNNSNNDLFFNTNSHALTLNTTFDKSGIAFVDTESDLIVRWYLHVKLIEPDNDPIPNVTIYINDTFGNQVEGSPFLTDINGYAKWIITLEYFLNLTDEVNYNPYNVTAIVGNHKKYAIPDPIVDISKTIIIEMDPFKPIADAGTDDQVNEDEQYIFNAAGSYDNVGIVNYTWDYDDGYFGYGINPTHTYSFNRTYVVTLNVSDQEGNWDTDTVNITVSNVPPIAEAGFNITIEEGQNITFDASASTDTPSDIISLAYSWFFGDGNYSEGITVNHSYEDNGTFLVTLQVTDDDGSQDFDYITITVKNTAPIITQIPLQILEEDSPYFLQIIATDVIGDTLAFSDNTTIFDINSTTGIISFTPTNEDVGIHYVTIYVEDDDGGESFIEIEMDIQNTNDVPNITSWPLTTVDEDSIYYYNITAIDDDLDGLTYILETMPDGMAINTHGNIGWVPNNDQVGEHIVVVNVSDPFGAYILQEYNLIVTNTNDAPVLNPIGPLEATEDEIFSFIVFAIDIDIGDSLTFYDDSELFDINSTTGNITVIPDNDDVETYTINISVMDSNGSVDFEIILFKVINTNNPPTITHIESQTLTEDLPFTMAVVAYDIDTSDSLTFLDNTTLFDINPISGIITFSPTNDDVGIHSINISVRDENGSFAYQIITFSVINVNDPPSIEPIGELTAEEGKQFNYQVTASDIDKGDTITFSDNTELFDIDPNTGEISFIPSEKDAGMHQVIITVTDGNGDSNQITFTITVVGNEDESIAFIWILLTIVIVLIVFFLGYFVWKRRRTGLSKEENETVEFTETVMELEEKP